MRKVGVQTQMRLASYGRCANANCVRPMVGRTGIYTTYIYSRVLPSYVGVGRIGLAASSPPTIPYRTPHRHKRAKKIKKHANRKEKGISYKMEISFFMPMNPPTVTHQEHKVTVVNGKPRFYEPSELKAARQLLSSHLAQHRPKKKISTGCALTVIWCFPCGKHENREPMLKKPDTDNLQKLLKDCMTAVGFWSDDALVFSEAVMKFYSEPSGIYIKVVTLDEE